MRCIKEEVIHSDKVPAGIFLQGLQYGTSIVNPHWHTQVELNLMLVGSAYFVVNGKKHILREGEMNIINTETVHCGGPLIYGDSMELITLLWDYDFFERFFPDMNDHYFQLANKPEQLRDIINTMIEIAVQNEIKSPFYELKISEAFMHIASVLLEHFLIENHSASPLRNSRRDPLISRAAGFINSHYNEPISLQLVADYVNLSPAYFSRYFKEHTGVNYQEYLTKLRLKHAVADLRNTEDSVTDVAYNNGFPNVNSFISQFKKTYQTTPKQYKKNAFV